MSYSTGLLDKRMTILTRSEKGSSSFGSGGKGYDYLPTSTVWCNVTFQRGVKAMREGAYDAIDTIMIRCRYTDNLTRECRVSVDNKIYQIESFHADKRENIMQLTASEITA